MGARVLSMPDSSNWELSHPRQRGIQCLRDKLLQLTDLVSLHQKVRERNPVSDRSICSDWDHNERFHNLERASRFSSKANRLRRNRPSILFLSWIRNIT